MRRPERQPCNRCNRCNRLSDYCHTRAHDARVRGETCGKAGYTGYTGYTTKGRG